MSLENPISTIKKAIRGKAEEMASKEYLDKPEQRHLDKVLGIYKSLRNNPKENFEKQVKYDVERKILKDQMGIEAHKTFNKIWEDLLYGPNGLKYKLHIAMNQIFGDRKRTVPEVMTNIADFYERFFKIEGEFLKMNPSIAAAFLGKEDILNKKIELEVNEFMNIYRDSDSRKDVSPT